jgi:hypothetical protein
MKALKKTSAALIAIAASASAFAGSDIETRVNEIEKKIEMLSTTTAMGNFGPSLVSARAEPDGMGWNLSLDVLYWQTKMGNSTYCAINDGIANSPIKFNMTPREPNFQWAWGFKIGAGYNFDHDKWDTKLKYTFFRNHGKDYVNPLSLPSGIMSPMIDAGVPLTFASLVAYEAKNVRVSFADETRINLKNRYDNLYLDLGRDFFVSKYLSLRPSFGAEAAWFTFTSNMKFTGGASQTALVPSTQFKDGQLQSGYTQQVTLFNAVGDCNLQAMFKEKFVGIGPRAGLDSRWHLGEGFSIYGDVNAALLYGYFKLNASQQYTDQPQNLATAYYKFHRLVPTAKFELGVVYDKYIMCETQHVSIALGYENQYYWDVYTPVVAAGVGMYGVDLKFQWDF